MDASQPEGEDFLGVVESPFPSPRFARNFTQAFGDFRAERDPLRLYPVYPFDPVLPSGAKYNGMSHTQYCCRPRLVMELRNARFLRQKQKTFNKIVTPMFAALCTFRTISPNEDLSDPTFAHNVHGLAGCKTCTPLPLHTVAVLGIE